MYANLAYRKFLRSYRILSRIARRLHAEGRRIVFTSGVFDHIHPGHIEHFRHVKKLFPDCVLVVAIGSDKITREDKGRGRPEIGQQDRAMFVADLPEVDFVIINREKGLGGRISSRLLEILQPESFVVAVTEDDKRSYYYRAKKEFCENNGIDFVDYPRELFFPKEYPGVSTTGILTLLRIAA